MFKKIPLHLQIFIALIGGTLFGIIFSVDKTSIDLIYLENGDKIEVVLDDWDKVFFINNNEVIKEYLAEDQLKIIKYYNSLKSSNKKGIILKYLKEKDGRTYEQIYQNIIFIAKPQTLATHIKPIGDLFIRLLRFLAIPIVIASLIVGAASFKDVKKLGRVGGKTFGIYIITTAIAITIGLGIANIVEPGNMIESESKARLLSTFENESASKSLEQLDISIVDFFVNIVPQNPIEAMSTGNMLQIVFFAVIFGFTLNLIEKKYSAPVFNFFEGVSKTMIRMVDIFMLIAPIGVFALIAATIADFGVNIVSTLIWYSLAVVFGLLMQTTLVYGFLVKFIGKMKLSKFYKGMRNAQAIGFSTSSSAATLPITFDCVENKLGVKKEISGFVLPLGATINMDGTALYQGVAAVFIAQVYGFDLTIADQLTIVLTAVLASIGTAPVPGVGLIMLVMILDAIHVPGEGIALILGVDRVLDMLRTVTNVTGDAAVAVAINSTESRFEKNV